MYAFAFVWVMLCVILFCVAVTGLRVAWELLKLAFVVGFGGAVLIVMGVI